MDWNSLAITIITILIVSILFEAIRIHLLGRKAVIAGKLTRPVSQKTDFEVGRILVIGDSTSYGTGASKPRHSLVGQLAAGLKDVTIVNASENALSIKQIREKMETLLQDKFDLVMIHAGGMDTVAFTSLRAFEKELKLIFAYTKEMSPKKVFLISVNNTGSVPFFHAPLSQIYTYRSRKISRLCQKMCEDYDAVHIPLFTELSEEPLCKNGKWHISCDKIHPNDEGYRIWYKKINSKINTYISDFKNKQS